jgi:hypothetical protein
MKPTNDNELVIADPYGWYKSSTCTPEKQKPPLFERAI